MIQFFRNTRTVYSCTEPKLFCFTVYLYVYCPGDQQGVNRQNTTHKTALIVLLATWTFYAIRLRDAFNVESGPSKAKGQRRRLYAVLLRLRRPCNTYSSCGKKISRQGRTAITRFSYAIGGWIIQLSNVA